MQTQKNIWCCLVQLFPTRKGKWILSHFETVSRTSLTTWGSFNCFQCECLINMRQTYSIVSLMQPVRIKMLWHTWSAGSWRYWWTTCQNHWPAAAQLQPRWFEPELMHSKTSGSQNLVNLAANYHPEVAGTLRGLSQVVTLDAFLMPRVWQRADICFHWLFICNNIWLFFLSCCMWCWHLVTSFALLFSCPGMWGTLWHCRTRTSFWSLELMFKGLSSALLTLMHEDCVTLLTALVSLGQVWTIQNKTSKKTKQENKIRVIFDC